MTFFTRTRITILKYIITAVALILVILNLPAQNSFQKNYHPLTPGDTTYKLKVIEQFKPGSDIFLDSVSKRGSKDKKKQYQVIFKERQERITGLFENDALLWDDSITIYLNHVLNKLVKANPELTGKKYLLTYRTSVPNAFSVGEGVIFFNLGLLNRLKNEAEIAFVLGHELVHDRYNHVSKKIIKLVETVTDKEFKEKYETAAKSEFNNYHKVQALFKNTLFDFNKHGREHEEQADSLGALWMARAGYNPQNAITAIALLDSVDEEKYPEPIDYKNFFSTADFKFKEDWLKGEDFLKWFKSKKELENEGNDTMKTHPDCKKRVEAAKRLFSDGKFKGTEGTLSLKNNLNLVADFEIIEHEHQVGLYGISLYNSLHLAQLFPDNIYLKGMIAKNLYFLYRGLKDHEFSDHTDVPNPYYSNNYNQFLNFINNLRSSEFVTLANNYIKKHGMTAKDKQYDFAVILCLSMDPDKSSVADLVAGYNRDYPGTDEAKYLSQKLTPLKNQIKKN